MTFFLCSLVLFVVMVQIEKTKPMLKWAIWCWRSDSKEFMDILLLISGLGQ